MNTIFPPAPQVVLPIAGSEAGFPVRRVYCVGQNYSDHSIEMGVDTREPPFFFSKPVDALVPGGGEVAYPPMTENFQHEVELVIAIGTGGTNIPVEQALEHVFGYAVGFDLTRRDLQARAKEKKQPWEMGKGLDQGGPISAICPVAVAGHPSRGRSGSSVMASCAERRSVGHDVENSGNHRQPVLLHSSVARRP